MISIAVSLVLKSAEDMMGFPIGNALNVVHNGTEMVL